MDNLRYNHQTPWFSRPRGSKSDVTESKDFKLLRREVAEFDEVLEPNLTGESMGNLRKTMENYGKSPFLMGKLTISMEIHGKTMWNMVDITKQQVRK
jgi:hypothetical protein